MYDERNKYEKKLNWSPYLRQFYIHYVIEIMYSRSLLELGTYSTGTYQWLEPNDLPSTFSHPEYLKINYFSTSLIYEQISF